MSRITCQLCGKQVHAIMGHLNEDHGPGAEEYCTLQEYKDRFPEAPLLSEAAQKIINERRKEKEATKETATVKAPEVVSNDGVAKKPLRILFELPKEGTMTERGKEIPVSVMDYEGDEEYIPDVDPNYCFDIENLKTCLMGMETKMNTFVYGHAGVGKSTLIEQICARTKRRLVRIQHTVMTEESHIVGQHTIRAKECPETGKVVQKMEFELGLLPLAMKHGWVFMADEYDRCPPSVSSVYQSVLEGKPLVIKEADHENRIIKPHKNFVFVATGNSNGSGDETGLYQATMQQDAATMERFGVVIKQDYMPRDLEVAVVQAQGRVDKKHAEKIVDFGHQIRKSFPHDISITLGPRVLINIAKMGMAKGDFSKGVEVSYANRLPDTERKAALEVAQRMFG